MVKHKLKNIANRPIPISGTDLIPIPGEIVKVELTERLIYLIKNKFFEDLGECSIPDNSEDKKKDVSDFPAEIVTKVEYPSKSFSKGKRGRKKKNKEMI